MLLIESKAVNMHTIAIQTLVDNALLILQIRQGENPIQKGIS